MRVGCRGVAAAVLLVACHSHTHDAEHAHEAPHAHEQAHEHPSPPDAAAAELAAYEHARPVFEKHCARCHTPAGPLHSDEALEHFKMDAYPFAGHHAHEIAGAIRRVLGATGERPTMPRDEPGIVTDDELALVIAWADAFDRAHPPAGGHEHGEHHHD